MRHSDADAVSFFEQRRKDIIPCFRGYKLIFSNLDCNTNSVHFEEVLGGVRVETFKKCSVDQLTFKKFRVEKRALLSEYWPRADPGDRINSSRRLGSIPKSQSRAQHTQKSRNSTLPLCSFKCVNRSPNLRSAATRFLPLLS